MTDEAFLRAIIASPEDDATRLIYADWLQERGDPRAELLRQDWAVQRISFIDWWRVQDNLDFYLGRHRELRSELEVHQANQRWRERLAALGDTADSDWVAVVDTLGRPFHPFFFWNNTGSRSYAPGELPFRDQIGTRGTVVTFQSAFQGEGTWNSGLVSDLQFLRRLRLQTCYYGAATSPVHPFICEVPTARYPMTGADVLATLQAREFRSEHIQQLDVPAIPFPGYHAQTLNDEVHNDPLEQNIFPRPGEPAVELEEIGGEDDPHEALREYIRGGQLWYVLLHNRSNDPDEILVNDGEWVVLFAVGLSPQGQRLVGVVSHQSCHNLCD